MKLMNLYRLGCAFLVLLVARSERGYGGTVSFEDYQMALAGLDSSVEVVYTAHGEGTSLQLRVRLPVPHGTADASPVDYHDMVVTLRAANRKPVVLAPRKGEGEHYQRTGGYFTGTYQIPEGWDVQESKLTLDWLSKKATTDLVIGPARDMEFSREVEQIRRAAAAIKPGQTRKDLQKDFTGDGGLSESNDRRYVSRVCPTIKIEVTFKTMHGDKESLDDVILTVSKPFLEGAIYD